MIADAIRQAILVAKKNMGDLLQQATLRVQTGSSYVDGVKTLITSDTAVEGVSDKFSYQEMQAEDFVQTDLKFLIFNNEAQTINPKVGDSLVLAGSTYQIRKVHPVNVGGFKVVFELVLRQ